MIRGLLLLLALVPACLAGAVRWNDILKQPAEWYATDEAQAVAAHVLLWQHASGGWPKNTDLSRAADGGRSGPSVGLPSPPSTTAVRPPRSGSSPRSSPPGPTRCGRPPSCVVSTTCWSPNMRTAVGRSFSR